VTESRAVANATQTLEITRLGTIGMAAAAMTIGDGSVWIVEDFAPALHQVDARSGAFIQSVPVGAVPDEIAYVGGAVWLLDTGGGTLARVTPGETAPAPAESIGTDPVDLAVGLDDLWVADQAGNAVLRVEPVNGEVISTIDVGNPVAAVTLDESGERDLVWVLVAEPQQHD
jgi:streptogramin lyase